MKIVLNENLKQLSHLLHAISIVDYIKEVDILSGSSIGQHMRHILEFYQIIVFANSKLISYDNRTRNKELQEDPKKAIAAIEQIIAILHTLDEKQDVKIEADFTTDGESCKEIKSSLGREMAYGLEHSIHHQALIKAGLIALNLKELVSDNFGVAYSTIRFKKQTCAQ